MGKKEITKFKDGSFQIADSEISENIIKKVQKLIKEKTTKAQTNFEQANYKNPIFFTEGGVRCFGDQDAFRRLLEIRKQQTTNKVTEMLK